MYGESLRIEMVGGALPVFYVLYALVADFWLRVAIQRPIALRTDAYALLPVARSVVTHHFVLRAVAAPYNIFEVVCVALPFVCGCGVWNVKCDRNVILEGCNPGEDPYIFYGLFFVYL